MSLVILQAVVFAGGYSANDARKVLQEPRRRAALAPHASARAPGRPVLPFGDVEGWNLRTRNGAVYYWDILTLSTTSRQSYRGAASRRPYGRSVRRELPTQQRLWWVWPSLQGTPIPTLVPEDCTAAVDALRAHSVLLQVLRSAVDVPIRIGCQ